MLPTSQGCEQLCEVAHLTASLVPGTWEKFSKKHMVVFFPSWWFVIRAKSTAPYTVFYPALSLDLFLKWLLATPCNLVSDLFQGNGHEEVVACAWDGQTYIIDHNRTVVRFQVDENVRAFCAGGPLPHTPLTHCLPLISILSVSPNVNLHKQMSSLALSLESDR